MEPMCMKVKYKVVCTIVILFMILMTGCEQNRDIQPGHYSITVEEDGPFRNAVVNLVYILSADEVDTMRTAEKMEKMIQGIKNHMMDRYGISVHFEFIPIKGSYEVIKKRMNANDSIDAFTPYLTQMPGIDTPITNQKVLSRWISEFDIADLTEYADQYYPELKKLADDPYFRDAVMINDKIVGVPGLNALCGDFKVLVVDRQYYRSVGSPNIESIDDLYELIKGTERLSAKERGIVLCSFQDILTWHCGNNETVYLKDMLAYDDIAGNIISLADTQILKDAYEKYQKMAHLINDLEIFSSLNTDHILIHFIPYQLFKNFYTGSTYKFEDHYEFFYMNTPLTITYDNYKLNCFINGSSNIEATLTFLRTLTYEEEVYDLLRYGIKDKNFIVDANGCVVLDKDIVYGWETAFKFLERSRERPFSYELGASKDVFFQYLRNENYFMNQTDYRKITGLTTKYISHPELSQLLKKFNVQTLFNSPGEYRILSYHDLFTTGMNYDEFKAYYDIEEMKLLTEKLQSFLYD